MDYQFGKDFSKLIRTVMAQHYWIGHAMDEESVTTRNINDFKRSVPHGLKLEVISNVD